MVQRGKNCPQGESRNGPLSPKRQSVSCEPPASSRGAEAPLDPLSHSGPLPHEPPPPETPFPAHPREQATSPSEYRWSLQSDKRLSGFPPRPAMENGKGAAPASRDC